MKRFNTPIWIMKTYKVVINMQRLHRFVINTPLMMAEDRPESTTIPVCYGSFLNQFLPDAIKSMRQLEKTYTKICRQKMSTLFNEIIYIYIYIYIFEVVIYLHIESSGFFHTIRVIELV